MWLLCVGRWREGGRRRFAGLCTRLDESVDVMCGKGGGASGWLVGCIAGWLVGWLVGGGLIGWQSYWLAVRLVGPQ
eukprot:177277-Chlamydomonas_euryale.AAC.1